MDGGAFRDRSRRYHPLIASVLVMTTPNMFGAVIGFLLLDQKDDRTLTALQVTPLTVGGYLTYRIAIPMVLSVAMTLVALEISGLSGLGSGKQLLAAVAAAPLAPVYALFLVAFARKQGAGVRVDEGCRSDQLAAGGRLVRGSRSGNGRSESARPTGAPSSTGSWSPVGERSAGAGHRAALPRSAGRVDAPALRPAVH